MLKRVNKLLNFKYFIFYLIILYGGVLRFWGIDKNQIFADEVHTLKSAAENSFSWIFTHFGVQDTCIPLTLYNKFFIETIGLNEWIFRMPSLICGTVLLLAVSHFMAKRFSLIEQIFVIGILAVSPYFVYLSREARPYIIITLFIWLALVLVMKWRINRNALELLSASVFSALAIYFHPVVLPVVIIIGCYPLVFLFYEKAPKHHWVQFAAAAILFGLILACLMLPPALSLSNGISHKGGKGIAGLETIQDGLSLLHGLPINFPLWVWGLLLFFGGVSLFKRFPHETLFMLAAGALQLLVLFVFQPRKMEIPWVWLRYVVHLLPWFIIACIAGFISIISFLNPINKKTSLPVFCSMVIIVCWAAWHMNERDYGIFSTSSYNVHPMILMIDKDRKHINNFSPVAEFYQSFPTVLQQGHIIEAPMLFTFPLYQFYQLIHGQNYQTAGVGSGYAQNIFNDHDGLKFKSAHRLAKNSIQGPDGNKFLIVHKRIGEEMVSAYECFCKNKYESKQLFGMEYLFKPTVLNSLFGNDGFIDPLVLNISGQKVFEDEWVAVYKLDL